MKFGIFEIVYPVVWRFLPYVIRYRITQFIERIRYRSEKAIPSSNVYVVCFSEDSASIFKNDNTIFVNKDFTISNQYDLLISCKNERESILEFLQSVERQKYLPKNLLICDAGDDKEVDYIIAQWSEQNSEVHVIHFKLPDSKIATARNELAKRAKSDILLYADLGTKLEETWVERILYPFENPSIDVSMGWYVLEGEKSWQKELMKFISQPLEQLSLAKFLPSTRSIGIRARAFAETSGFNEDLSLAAEDSLFGYQIKAKGFTLAFSPDARVHWRLSSSKRAMWKKLMKYAQGDAETGFLFWSHYVKQLLMLTQMLFDITCVVFLCVILNLISGEETIALGIYLCILSVVLRFGNYLRSFGPLQNFDRIVALSLLVTAQMYGFVRGLTYLLKNKKLLRIVDEYK